MKGLFSLWRSTAVCVGVFGGDGVSRSSVLESGMFCARSRRGSRASSAELGGVDRSWALLLCLSGAGRITGLAKQSAKLRRTKRQEPTAPNISPTGYSKTCKSQPYLRYIIPWLTFPTVNCWPWFGCAFAGTWIAVGSGFIRGHAASRSCGIGGGASSRRLRCGLAAGVAVGVVDGVGILRLSSLRCSILRALCSCWCS